MHLNLFFKKSPFIRLILPIISGICIAFQIPEMKIELSILTVTSFFCFVGLRYWLKKKAVYRYRYLSGVIGFTFFLFFAALFMQLRMPQVLSVEDESTLKFQLVENIGETDKNYKYEAYALSSMDDSLRLRQKCRGIVFIPKKQDSIRLNSGDILYAYGRFIAYSDPDSQFDFDYSAYLRNQRMLFRFLVQDYQSVTNKSEKPNLFIQSARLKQYLREQYVEAGLTKSQVAILNALFLGDKSKLTYEQKVAFSNAGAMHLLAVSGLHVGIIYMLLISILTTLGFKKNTIGVAFFVISVLWIYAFITGFSPSVLRSSLMFTILEIGRISKRKTGIFNLLGASMFIIMIIEPLSIFNIGFWLSHCAVASIVSFYQKINNWVRFSFPPFRWIWSIIAVSLSAQIGTLPLCIYAFYGFPLYFIITNILLIPIVTPILILAVLSSVFSFSSLLLSVLIPALGDLLNFMEQTALWVDSLPYSIISNLYLNGFQLVWVYATIVFLLVFFDYRFVRYLKLAIISIIIVLVSVHIRNHQLPDEVLFVANIRGKSVVNYLNSSSNIIYTNEELTEKEIDFAFSGLWAYCLAKSEYTVVIMNHKQIWEPVVKLIGNQCIAIVPEHAEWDCQVHRTHLDKLVLLGKPNMSLGQLRTTIRVKQLVLPTGWKWYQKRKWLKEHSKYVENVYDVAEDGVLFVVSGNQM